MYRPWIGRGIGIELEMNNVRADGRAFSLADMHRVVSAALPSTERVVHTGYSHNNGQVWECKTDGSCGYEFTTPILTLDEEGDNANLRAACDALKAFRPRIDRNCGFHLHVSCRGVAGQRDWTWQDLQRFLALWSRYEPYLFEMLPPSRKNNQYCAPIFRTTWTGQTHSTFAGVRDALATTSERRFQTALQSRSRYHSLNISHFWIRGSLEFRLHSGTVDYVKIRNWSKLILAMIARVTNDDMPRIQLNVSESPEGFSTRYIFRQFGLIVGRHIREVPASNRDLLVWADARRLLFDPNAMRRPGMRDATGRRVHVADVANAEGVETDPNANAEGRNAEIHRGQIAEARRRAALSGRSALEEHRLMNAERQRAHDEEMAARQRTNAFVTEQNNLAAENIARVTPLNGGI
jgi:hypothetical protein